MNTADRRHFLKTTAAATTLTALTAAGAAAKPSEKIVLAIMGVHGRGRGLVSGFAGLAGTEIAYIIDPDSNVLPGAVKIVEDRQKRTPKTEKDVRKILEEKDVDALLIAAPDHWHALATVWACQAGK